MEKYEIKTYKGYAIYFNEYKDAFECPDFDDVLTFNSLKKFQEAIDAYRKKMVKDKFKPIKALKANLRYGEKEKRIATSTPHRITITGIKKDGGLMCMEKNEKTQLNKTNYSDDRKQLFILDEDAETVLGVIAALESDIDILERKKKELLKRFVPLDLKFIDQYL